MDGVRGALKGQNQVLPATPAASSNQKVGRSNPAWCAVHFQCFAHSSKLGMPMGMPIGAKISKNIPCK